MYPANHSDGFLRQLLVLSSQTPMQLHHLLRFASEGVRNSTESDIGAAVLVSPKLVPKPLLVTSSAEGPLAVEQEIASGSEQLGSLIEFALRSGKPTYLSDHRQAPQPCPLLGDARSSLTAPILEGREVTGFLHVASHKPHHYRDSDLHDLGLAAAQTDRAVQRLLFRERVAQVRGSINIVGVSGPFLELERRLKLMSSCDAPVLVAGERGTGKELAALAIHFWSQRRDKPFVPVLASGLAEGLLADELFGHEPHAFTGARTSRRGKFQAAARGTLFLDEIGDLPAEVQSALLRVIQWGEVQTLGKDLPERVDVRVIAATNKDLGQLVAEGRFRHDLYDRLRVLELEVPPLRTRREDIRLLTEHFLRRLCTEIRQDTCRYTAGGCPACRAMAQPDCATDRFFEALQRYDWPGNIRELENLILRLLTMMPDQIFDVKHLPGEIVNGKKRKATPDCDDEDLTLAAANRRHIEKVLSLVDNNQTRAARILGIPRTTLQAKLSRLGISPTVE